MCCTTLGQAASAQFFLKQWPSVILPTLFSFNWVDTCMAECFILFGICFCFLVFYRGKGRHCLTEVLPSVLPSLPFILSTLFSFVFVVIYFVRSTMSVVSLAVNFRPFVSESQMHCCGLWWLAHKERTRTKGEKQPFV